MKIGIRTARPKSTNSVSLAGIKSAPLSQVETEMLGAHEQTITDGLGTFFEVGSALLAIRQEKLYRQSHATFEEYCRERWGFGRTYAWRIIGAAERLNLLPEAEKAHKPTSEFQMRPFLKLAPEAFPGVWKQVLEKAKDGKITSRLIGKLIEETAHSQRAETKNQLVYKKLSFSKGTIGEMIVLLDQAKRFVNRNESEHAINTIERIERLIFPQTHN